MLRVVVIAFVAACSGSPGGPAQLTKIDQPTT
jgi:hypothetical protein